jgi:nucleoside-diphosphate-sugar epimerase
VQVLITGATGLVGAETVDHVRAAEPTATVTATSRRGRPEDPAVIRWDIAAEPPPPELRRRWDVIVHTAADTRWTMTPAQAEAANVDSVTALGAIVAADTHVIYVSTAYAIGLRGDADSADIADYRNAYEWSKAQAERVAGERFGRLSIVRPPLIIGRRGDGRATRFAGMYTVLRAMTASMVPAIVAADGARFDVIPVDDLAALIGGLARTGPAGEVRTIAGGASAPGADAAIGVISDSLNGWRRERGLEAIERPPVIDPDRWERFFLPFAREHLSPRQRRVLDLLQNFNPYMSITEPLRPTDPVTGVEPALALAVRFWADSHVREASLSQRPWKVAERARA